MLDFIFFITMLTTILSTMLSASLLFIYQDLFLKITKNGFLSGILGGIVYLTSFGVSIYSLILLANKLNELIKIENLYITLCFLLILSVQWSIYYLFRLAIQNIRKSVEA